MVTIPAGAFTMGSDDGPSLRQGLDPAALECPHKLSRRRIGQYRLFARLWVIEQGAVLGHHPLEQAQVREDGL